MNTEIEEIHEFLKFLRKNAAGAAPQRYRHGGSASMEIFAMMGNFFQYPFKLPK